MWTEYCQEKQEKRENSFWKIVQLAESKRSSVSSVVLCALPVSLWQVLTAIVGEVTKFISRGSFIVRNLVIILVLPLPWRCFHCRLTRSPWGVHSSAARYIPSQWTLSLMLLFFFFRKILNQCSNSELTKKKWSYKAFLLYMWFFDYINLTLDWDIFRLQHCDEIIPLYLGEGLWLQVTLVPCHHCPCWTLIVC